MSGTTAAFWARKFFDVIAAAEIEIVYEGDDRHDRECADVAARMIAVERGEIDSAVRWDLVAGERGLHEIGKEDRRRLGASREERD